MEEVGGDLDRRPVLDIDGRREVELTETIDEANDLIIVATLKLIVVCTVLSRLSGEIFTGDIIIGVRIFLSTFYRTRNGEGRGLVSLGDGTLGEVVGGTVQPLTGVREGVRQGCDGVTTSAFVTSLLSALYV